MMDPDIKDYLSDIKLQVKEGFTRVDARFDGTDKQIDQLVTKGEFNAVIHRIDSEHQGLRRDHNNLSVKAERAIEAANKGDLNIRAELHQELDAFRAASRWSVGISLTIATGVFGIITWAAKVL
jgi:hypothetical protein